MLTQSWLYWTELSVLRFYTSCNEFIRIILSVCLSFMCLSIRTPMDRSSHPPEGSIDSVIIIIIAFRTSRKEKLKIVTGSAFRKIMDTKLSF